VMKYSINLVMLLEFCAEMKRIYFDVMAEFKQHGCKVLLSYNNNSNNNCLLS
jgi:hypothetical protein